MNVLLSLLIVSVSVAVTSGTRCYVCSGAGNSDCGDTYDNEAAHEMDCFASGMTEDGGCTKYKSKKENVLGFFATTVERKCGQAYDNLLCEGFVRKEGNVFVDDRETHIFACSCSGDLCNSAPVMASHPSTLLLLTAALLGVMTLTSY